MAQKKISQLTLATSVTGADLVPVVQGGVTKRAAVSSLGGIGATGPTGAAATGPTGATGAASTVTGPTGSAGAASTVTGPTGAAGSTGPGVTGPTGSSYTNVVVTPTAIAANTTVTGYSPGSGDIYRLAVTGSTGVNLWGLGITGVAGDAKLLINVGAAAPINLQHATGPNANAQFAVPWGGTFVMSANGGAALIVYDATSQVWRVV